jgi:hypothetical protein
MYPHRSRSYRPQHNTYRGVVYVDSAMPRGERFENGAVAFARGRKLTPITQSVYDKVRSFLTTDISESITKIFKL